MVLYTVYAGCIKMVSDVLFLAVVCNGYVLEITIGCAYVNIKLNKQLWIHCIPSYMFCVCGSCTL